MSLAGTYARVLADLGEHRDAVFMLGAADAMRERLDHPRSATQTAEIAAPINKTRVALSREEWDAVYSAGRDTSIEDALSFR
jgi:hypothetical protein